MVFPSRGDDCTQCENLPIYTTVLVPCWAFRRSAFESTSEMMRAFGALAVNPATMTIPGRALGVRAARHRRPRDPPPVPFRGRRAARLLAGQIADARELLERHLQYNRDRLLELLT
jgi:hypothetical protein